MTLHTPNPLDRRSATPIVTLLTFEWGAGPTFARYARARADVQLFSAVFSALPTIEVDYGDQHGGVKDEPFKIRISSSVLPVSKMVGQRYGPTRVLVQECDPDDPNSTVRAMAAGVVGPVRANPAGKAGVAEIQVRGWKSDLEVPLGLVCDSFCQWRFGDRWCQKDIEALKRAAVINAVDGPLVYVTGAAVVGQAEPFWSQGHVVVDAYRIKIRSRGPRPDLFELVRPPPSDWLGAAATFYPGCDKTVESCRRWGQEHRMVPLGIAMPNHHPLIEEGD